MDEIATAKNAEAEEKRAKMEKRARQMVAKRKELQEQQAALEKQMAQGYQEEQKNLIIEAKEAKRLEMLSRLRAQALKEDERLNAMKRAKEESAIKVEEDMRQSHSENMMKSFNAKRVQAKPMEALPDIAKSSQANVQGFGSAEPNPLDDLEDKPLGATAQAASISQPKKNSEKDKKAAASGQESLEERKLRLQARSEALKKKKRDEEEAKKPKAEEQKRDQGDIFRNTAMKFNENPDQKKMRLKRCLNALQKADVGAPSAFVGMKVGQRVDIEWNRPENNGLEVEDADDEDNASIQFQKVGKSILQNDDGF